MDFSKYQPELVNLVFEFFEYYKKCHESGLKDNSMLCGIYKYDIETLLNTDDKPFTSNDFLVLNHTCKSKFYSKTLPIQQTRIEYYQIMSFKRDNILKSLGI